jgi:nitrate reductase cytochrome c-type subunit
MFVSTIRKAAASLAFLGVMLTVTPSFADEAKVPQTAAEHEAKAKAYKDQAAQYRKLAEEHKQMAKEYAEKRPELKGVGKNPAVEKMSKHCLTLAKDYEKLATDAEKMADFHTMRAKELQGG